MREEGDATTDDSNSMAMGGCLSEISYKMQKKAAILNCGIRIDENN